MSTNISEAANPEKRPPLWKQREAATFLRLSTRYLLDLRNPKRRDPLPFISIGRRSLLFQVRAWPLRRRRI